MSVVFYNGITLPQAFTTKFDQSPMTDEVGQTDWYCTRFDIEVHSIINYQYIGAIAPELTNLESKSPADIMNYIRSQLLQPRKKLSVKFNQIELIPQNVIELPNSTVDVRNGPFPQSCNIVQLTNVTFFITFRIMVYCWENVLLTPALQSDNRIGNPVIYNRWSDSIDIDELNYSTRIREGTFRIRSDNLNGQIIDQLRPAMAQLSVPGGFLRESAKYTVSPDGLTMKYELKDKEVFKMPPIPSYKAKGTFTMSTNRAGALRFGECKLTLWGSKTVSQPQLVKTAMAVVSRKIGVADDNVSQPVFGKDTGILLEASVRVHMYENIVESSMKIIYKKSKPRIADINALNTKMCFVPYTDGVVINPPSYPVRGTASILLQAAAYYDPSIPNIQLDPATGQLTGGLVEPGQGGTA